MTYSELIKKLKKKGCYIIRHGSNHDIWFSPITQEEFPLPRHSSKEVPTGTCKNIIKASGI